MSIALNHTIIPAKDRWASARFLAGILGLEVGSEWGPFVPLQTHNGVTLDFTDATATDFRPHHYAFLVSDQEFDAAMGRLRQGEVAYFADHRREKRGEINQLYGGRGVYFADPSGHLMELITKPYGAVPEG